MGQETVVARLEGVFDNLDKDCFVRQMQKDMEGFNKWLTDTLEPLRTNPPVLMYTPDGIPLPVVVSDMYYRKPCPLDLITVKKVFALCVDFTSLDDYCYGDNIYDHLVVDSTKMMVAICLDKKDRVLGITDYEDRGALATWETFLSTGLSKRKFKNIYKNLVKRNPDFLLFCEFRGMGEIMYARNGKLFFFYPYYPKRREMPIEEDFLRKPIPFLRMHYSGERYETIRELFKKEFYQVESPTTRIGNTPESEIRICK